MRSTLVFLIALLAIASVASIQSSFNLKIQNNVDYKNKVTQVKKTNIGKMIMTLAQLHQGG